jgi:SAM-dependent methyltransferase
VDTYQKAWEKDYKNRGRLWGGGLPSLPDLPSGSRVLEIGCGNGKTLSAALRYPWTIAALDVSAEAVMLGRLGALERVAFLIADACHLPFRNLAFDAVFAFHVVGHMPLSKREKMASEAARVLKNGGRVFFRDFGLDDMRAGHGREVEPGTFMRGKGIITHYFTEDETASLFCKLEPLSIRTHRWKLPIKGKGMIRSEVESVFQKVS